MNDPSILSRYANEAAMVIDSIGTYRTLALFVGWRATTIDINNWLYLWPQPTYLSTPIGSVGAVSQSGN